MANGKVVVLGGGGFVGRHLVSRLVSDGWRVVVPSRRREAAKHLILLPTVEVIEADVNADAALARVLDGAGALVNLVGILNEQREGDFQRAHTEFARRLVAACRLVGVRRLVQMSSLNADPSGPSRYQRSKGEAEKLIAASDLDWTIFQPSVIFGREDRFLNLFASLLSMLPVMALAAPNARFQPVFVGDVAHVFASSLDMAQTHGKRYPLCGPRVYTLRELVAYVGELSGHRRPIIGLGPTLSALQARMLELLPGRLMSRDNLASMQVDSVCDCPFPAEFGITPAALESIAPDYLASSARSDRYAPYRTRHPGR